MALFQIFIVTRKNSYVCISEDIILHFFLFAFTFIPYFINKEIGKNNFNRKVFNEIIIITCFSIFLLIRFPFIVKKTKRIETDTTIGIDYFYECVNYFPHKTLGFFIWLLLVIQINYLMKRNPKRSKLIFKLQLYYFIISVIFSVLQIIYSLNQPITHKYILMVYVCYYILSLMIMIPIVLLIVIKYLSSRVYIHDSSQKATLHHFLRNKLLRQHFLCFCNINNAKAIEFYGKVLEYEKIKDKKQMEVKAEEILRNYVQPESDFLNDEIRGNIASHYSVIVFLLLLLYYFRLIIYTKKQKK